MVKTAAQGTQKAQAKNDPHVVYLRYKALLRRKALDPAKYNTVCAEKDEAAKKIIDSYNLDIRGKLNAWECWRQLYYTFFASRQTVVKVE